MRFFVVLAALAACGSSPVVIDAAPPDTPPDAGTCSVQTGEHLNCPDAGPPLECQVIPECAPCSPVIDGRCTLPDGVLRICTSACYD